MDEKSKVYALTDTVGRVIRIDGGYTINNIQDIEEWIFVDEGVGDRFDLCQNNYLPKPLTDERGVYRYKLASGGIVERTAAEMDADYQAETENLPPNIVHINREDFNLLDATNSNTIYYIAEPDHTITMIKGDNR